jgi:hypothetical protein
LTTNAFGRAFDQTVADLRSLLAAQADCAAIEQEETVNYWRVRVKPVAVTACPFELILYRNRRFDLTIGPETYKNRVFDDLGLFRRLIEAIVAGQVVTRTWVSVATGSVPELETRVRLVDDVDWKITRKTALADVIPADAVEWHDHYYVPYRRKRL